VRTTGRTRSLQCSGNVASTPPEWCSPAPPCSPPQKHHHRAACVVVLCEDCVFERPTAPATALLGSIKAWLAA